MAASEGCGEMERFKLDVREFVKAVVELMGGQASY